MEKCENCINDALCSEFMKNGLFPNSRIETSEPIHKRTAKCACNCKYFKDRSPITGLRCKVGDTVYILIEELEDLGGPYITEEKVVELSTAGRIWTDSSCYDSDDIGKMLFLTSVDAENALDANKNTKKTRRTMKMSKNENCCRNCRHSCGTKKLYCTKLTKDVEPDEMCFQFSEKYCEALEKLRRQFVKR